MHEQKKNILSLNDSLPTNFDVQKTKFQILFDTLSQNWTRIEMFERRFHKVFQLKMLTVPHDMVLETTTALWAIITRLLNKTTNDSVATFRQCLNHCLDSEYKKRQ